MSHRGGDGPTLDGVLCQDSSVGAVKLEAGDTAVGDTLHRPQDIDFWSLAQLVAGGGGGGALVVYGRHRGLPNFKCRLGSLSLLQCSPESGEEPLGGTQATLAEPTGTHQACRTMFSGHRVWRQLPTPLAVVQPKCHQEQGQRKLQRDQPLKCPANVL